MKRMRVKLRPNSKPNSITKYANCAIIEAQGHFFRLRMPHTGESVGGCRGAISGFSPQSRKRMLEKIARIDTEKIGYTCFVTLTYPDREGPPPAAVFERDRQTFFKRIKRQYPEASAIWRREWEERRSGRWVGISFPHYHLLFFGLPFVPYDEVNAMWQAVIGYDDYVRTEIKGIESWRQAVFYVAKYMAKPEAEQPSTREPQGEPGAGGDADSSLVYSTYLTEQEKGRIGRSWGVFNRNKVPWGEKQEVYLKPGDWLEAAKDMARQEWPGVNCQEGYGFSLFLDRPEGWVKMICTLQDLLSDSETGGDDAG